MNPPRTVTHQWDSSCPYCAQAVAASRDPYAEAEERRKPTTGGYVIAQFTEEEKPPRPSWAKE